MRPEKKYQKLNAGMYYHVYNRTNNKETLFRDSQDHLRFLNKLLKYISPFAHILSFNLRGVSEGSTAVSRVAVSHTADGHIIFARVGWYD